MVDTAVIGKWDGVPNERKEGDERSGKARSPRGPKRFVLAFGYTLQLFGVV